MDEKEQKYAELQMMQQQIEQLSQRTEEINAQLLDLGISKGALEEISKTTEGTPILAQIANGIFIKATLTKNSSVIVNVGADTVVEKTIPEVLEMLKEQETLLTQTADQIEAMLQNVGAQAMKEIEIMEDNDTKV